MATSNYNPWGWVMATESHTNTLHNRGDKTQEWYQRRHQHVLVVEGVVLPAATGEAQQHAEMLDRKEALTAIFRNPNDNRDVEFIRDFANLPANAKVRPVSIDFKQGNWVNKLEYTARLEFDEPSPGVDDSLFEYQEPMLDDVSLWDGTSIQQSRAIRRGVRGGLMQIETQRSISANISCPETMPFTIASGYYSAVEGWATTYIPQAPNRDDGPVAFGASDGWWINSYTTSIDLDGQSISYNVAGTRSEIVNPSAEVSVFGLDWWGGASITVNRTRINQQGDTGDYRVGETAKLNIDIQVPRDLSTDDAEAQLHQAKELEFRRQPTPDGYRITAVSYDKSESTGRYRITVDGEKFINGDQDTRTDVFGLTLWSGTTINISRRSEAQMLLTSEEVSVTADLPESVVDFPTASGWVAGIRESLSYMDDGDAATKVFRSWNNKYYRITSVNTNIDTAARRCNYSIQATRVLPTDVMNENGYRTLNDTEGRGFCVTPLYTALPVDCKFRMQRTRDALTGKPGTSYTIEVSVHGMNDPRDLDVRGYIDTIENNWIYNQDQDNWNVMSVDDGTALICTSFNKDYEPRTREGKISATFQIKPKAAVVTEIGGISVYGPEYQFNGTPMRFNQVQDGVHDGALLQSLGRKMWTLSMTAAVRPSDVSAVRQHLYSAMASGTYTLCTMSGYCVDASIDTSQQYDGGEYGRLKITITNNPGTGA